MQFPLLNRSEVSYSLRIEMLHHHLPLSSILIAVRKKGHDLVPAHSGKRSAYLLKPLRGDFKYISQ